MVVLPYDVTSSPVSIAYQSNLSIENVLLRSEENKLKVIGKINNSSSCVVFDIDLFTGEVSSFTGTSIERPIKAVFDYYDYALIYVEGENGNIDVYKYDDKTFAVTLFEKNIRSVFAGYGLFKIDGMYTRNDFIALDVTNDNSYFASFYRLKTIYPQYTTIEASGFPVTLGNQVDSGEKYNASSPLVLLDLYEYVVTGEITVRFNKRLHRLEVMRKNSTMVKTIECEKFLWASECYHSSFATLIAVVYNGDTIIHYLEGNDVIVSKIMTFVPELHERKVNEVFFIENKEKLTEYDESYSISHGNVYLIGGESEDAIFQDINEISVTITRDNDQNVFLDIKSTSIIPGNGGNTYGAYRAKGFKLSNKQLTVIYGLGYSHNITGTFDAKILKSTLDDYEEIETDVVHYITPDVEYISYFITTKQPALLSTTWGNTSPKGIVREAFVLSNHLYFTTGNNRYAAEINEIRQLSGVIQFNERFGFTMMPLMITNSDEKDAYSQEINKTSNAMIRYSGSDYFNSLFQHELSVIPYQSKFDLFKIYNFEEIIEQGTQNIAKVEKKNLESYEVIGILEPSFYNQDGYEFDVLVKRTFHNVKRKEYIDEVQYTVVPVEKSTIVSRIPCTPYRMDVEKRIDYVKEEEMDQAFNMAFVFNNGSHELLRDDYSYITDTWQIAISNGEEHERRIDIVINRGENPEIFSITGDHEKFPFKKDLLPIVLGYGDYEENILSYRYFVFVDIDGNVVTFDKKSKEFITIEGYDDIKVPYLSGEVTIFPSRTSLKGSIGKRVWGYSDENPYTTGSSEDKVSTDDESLV